MTQVVISQPMFFPWAGLFEQVRLADSFVHYDDVALPQGRSFMSRVQIKTAQGVQWLTVPVRRGATLIKDVLIDSDQNWQQRHIRTLRQAYAGAPYLQDMVDIVEAAYGQEFTRLAELNCYSIEIVARYFGISTRFLLSSNLPAQGRSTARLISLCNFLGASVYVTGHGAKNYLDHIEFEKAGIKVEYMDYAKKEYGQQHGVFTPFVSILDLVANEGPAGKRFLCSGTQSWRELDL